MDFLLTFFFQALPWICFHKEVITKIGRPLVAHYKNGFEVYDLNFVVEMHI